jgi:hypothetical protein
MNVKVVDDMSRFLVIELPGPATHEQRKKIAELVAAAISAAVNTKTVLNLNQGHGHVHARPDGVKARCGGPKICSVCAVELAQAGAALDRAVSAVNR